MLLKSLTIFVLVPSLACFSASGAQVLDGFESLNGWKNLTSDETVKVSTKTVEGRKDSAVEVSFEYTRGTGYCGIQKQFPLQLPENFQFTFYLKADAPITNFEFKLIDESGENVWWKNHRNFEFPTRWKKITIKKRDIEFAWGPLEDRSLKQIDKIQFFVASATGGAGKVYLDEFKFEELAVADNTLPNPVAEVSSVAEGYSAESVFDGEKATSWSNQPNDHQPEVVIDLKKHYEYGGLVIDWDQRLFAREYDVLFSHDKKDWQLAYKVTRGKGGKAFVPLKGFESRFLKLHLKKSSQNHSFVIEEIKVKDYQFSESTENMYLEMTKNHLRGYFPRYFKNEQSYWTLTGVNNDRDEALMNEDGMIEVDKSRFSIEPFLMLETENSKNKFLTWNDVSREQSLMDDYLPVPSVHWQKDGLNLQSQMFADGLAGESVLYLNYTLTNSSKRSQAGSLYLAIRPFQVNPPWQFLNWKGGTTKIRSIKAEEDRVFVDEKEVFKITSPDGFGAAEFDEGDIVEFVSQNQLPERGEVNDHQGLASAALRYDFDLSPGESKQVVLAVPFHESSKYVVAEAQVNSRLQAVKEFWQQKINTVEFKLPASADRLINTVRSNLAYILINRDGYGIQPGSRSYERSWIRDGALTSSALLKLGVEEEVKDFIDWYADYQYPNGAVPCVVDTRGPDPVPEHDSHGQLIFALMQYYQFTDDKEFLRNHFSHVQKSVEHMNYLRAQRMTEIYKTGMPTQRASYGLFPESISHEGYSEKPMHSYWDDFFGLKGYKDAVEIARLLGEVEQEEKFTAAKEEFQTDLYKSINRAVKNKGINYIPGCVELGDFDATSTAISIYPVNELKNLPQPQAQNTFDRYFKYFENRRDGKIDWVDYTPYEVRLIGTFIYLGQIERAHALIDFFFSDQRPAKWNHWAEVVRKGYDTTGFIGDMPHTWVGSDYISALRSMFVYENELESSLVIGAGLYNEWIESSEGVSVKKLPTYYGKIDYSLKKIAENKYTFKLSGSAKAPKGYFVLANRWQKEPKTVLVNGKSIKDFDAKKILIKESPAEVHIAF